MKKGIGMIDFRKNMYFFMKVITVVSFIGVIVAALGGGVAAILPSEFYGGLKNRIKLSHLQLEFPFEVMESRYVKWQMLLEIFRGFMIALTAFAICCMLLKILKNARNNSVFAKQNIGFVRCIGYMMVLLSVVPGAMSYITDLFVLKIAGGEKILNELGAAEVIAEGMVVNLFVLFLGVFVVFISHVFRRGSFLEEEYEMTL